MTAGGAGQLLAISDLHIGYAENRALVEQMRPETDEDWLLVAGDVSESVADIRWVLETLVGRFRKVIWAPGNHELWTHPKDPVTLRGVARYEHLVDLCRELGVTSPALRILRSSRHPIPRRPVEGRRNVRTRIPHPHPQPPAVQRRQPQRSRPLRVLVCVRHQLGRQQLHDVDDFVHAVTVQSGPHGHACDACGSRVMWQTEGVHPGVGQDYGDHEWLRREGDLDLPDRCVRRWLCLR